jgi:hypothetical protein
MIGRLLLVAAALLANPAAAFELGGLAVHLPAGYVAEGTGQRGATTAIGIVPPAGGPEATGLLGRYLCTVAFKANAPGSPLRSKPQAWHNAAAMEQDAMANMVGRTLRDGQPTIEGNTLVNDVVWLELVGIPRRASQTRVAYWSAATPAGTTTLTCAVSDAAFEGAFSGLRAIRDGITPPG